MAGVAASLVFGVAVGDGLRGAGPPPPDVVGRAATAAWAFNMMVTGTFAFVGFVLPTHRLLPEADDRVRRPGAPRAVRRGPRADPGRTCSGARRSPRSGGTGRRKFFDGTAAGPADFTARSRSAEFGHAGAFAPLTAAAA